VDHRLVDPWPADVGAGHADAALPGDLRDRRPVRLPALAAHVSTPVTTMPRMNARWARKKTTIGAAIVISAAAWMSVGCVAYSALYCWIAIDSGWSSGLLAR